MDTHDRARVSAIDAARVLEQHRRHKGALHRDDVISAMQDYATRFITTPATDQPQPAGVAIPEGMVEWLGGDAAPADWDGGAVWRDNKSFLHPHPTVHFDWRQPPKSGPWILAYTPKPVDAQPAGVPDMVLREALRIARDELIEGRFSTGYCMCGSRVEGHGMGDGHSPVDEGDYRLQGVIERIDAVLAVVPVQPAASDQRAEVDLGEAAKRVCIVLWGRDRMWESPIADQCIAIARAALASTSHDAAEGEV